MDFVVGGVGFGALAILVGLALRDGGAWWTRVRPSPAIGDEYGAALDAVCRRFGRLVALGGGLLLLVTLLALLVGASDGTGAVVVTAAVAAIAAALGAWLVRSIRHQLRPLAAWPAYPNPTPDRDPAPAAVASGPPSAALAYDCRPAATGEAGPLASDATVPSPDASSDQPNATAIEPPDTAQPSASADARGHDPEPEAESQRALDPRLPLPVPEAESATSSASTMIEASPRSTAVDLDRDGADLLPVPTDLHDGGQLAHEEATAVDPPAPRVDNGAGDGDDDIVSVTRRVDLP